MRLLLLVTTPVAVFLSHLLWNITVPYGDSPGLIIMAPPFRERILAYLTGEGFWMGASYALVGCFIIFTLGKFKERKREALVGAAGGSLMAGGIYALGCFMLGCCGSPMAVVWLGFLGGRYANLGGIFLFLLTLLSTSAGLWMLSRKGREKSVTELRG